MPKREVTRIDKPWGYEILYARTDRYAGKILHIERGKRLSLQFHRVKEETLFVQTGRMELEVGSGSERQSLVLGPGDCYHLPAGTVHRMLAIEDTDVLEVSSPELDDVVRIQDDYGRS